MAGNNETYSNLLTVLSDLSERVLTQSEMSNTIVADLLSAPSGITELEKAMVCVALYWYNQDVREDAPDCRNKSNDAVVETLANPNTGRENLDGGIIRTFWLTGFKYGSHGAHSVPSDYNNLWNGNSGPVNCGSDKTWDPYCAAFVMHCFIESLLALGLSHDNLTKLDFNPFDIVHFTRGRVKNKYDANNIIKNSNSGNDRSVIDSFIAGGAIVDTTPSVGGIFYRQREGGGHCGIVIKVDAVKRTFWTIEGNNDEAPGVSAFEYSFDEQIGGYSQYFLSLNPLGEDIQSKPLFSYDIEDMDKKDTTVYPLFTSYFGQSCWRSPQDVPVPKPSDSSTPDTPPPGTEKVPTPTEARIGCPAALTPITTLSPSRADTDGDARDTPQEEERRIKEYTDYYSKEWDDVSVFYDIDRDVYFVCGNKKPVPPPPPPVNDCPDGYARDKDGNCQPNIPPVNCCDYSGYIPSEANMLPITALMKSKHELDGLHHEVFTDILTVDLIGSGDKRKTSGKAMGVLNPNVDTGHNTGFGMFRGLKDFAAPSGMMRPIMSDSPDVKNNLYVIGYARTNNFWNAFVKGVICSVNTNKFNFGGLTPENYVNQAISEQIQDNYEGRDGLGDKPKMQIMKQWLFGSANAKVLYVRSESPKPGWLFECLVNNRSCDGSDHINAGRLFVSSEVDHNDYLGGKHPAANNLFEEYKAWLYSNSEYLEKLKKDKYSKPQFPTDGDWEIANTGCIVREVSGGYKRVQGAVCDFGSISAFLESYKDAAMSDIPILVVFDNATTGSLASSDFFSVASTLVSVALSVVSFGVGSAAFSSAANTVLTLVKSGLDLAERIMIAGNSGWNLADVMNTTLSIASISCTLMKSFDIGTDKEVALPIGIAKDGNQTVTSKGVITRVSDILSKIDLSWDGISGWVSKGLKDNQDILGVFGAPLLSISKVVQQNSYFNNQWSKFVKKTTGLPVDYIEKFQKALQGKIDKAPVFDWSKAETDDINSAMTMMQNIKNFTLTREVGDYFANKYSLLVERDLQQAASWKDVPVIKESIKNISNGALISALPSVDSLFGAALSLGSGAGFREVFSNYSKKTGFAMIKAITGMPVEGKELKDIIIDAFKSDSGDENTIAGFTPVYLPPYMDPEIKECVMCSFEKERPVVPCEEGMTYNYLTGKCEYGKYQGFTLPIDCYDVCKHVAVPSVVPEEIKQCEGVYYYDITGCGSPSTEAKVKAAESVGAAVLLGLTSALLDGKTTTEQQEICKCFVNSTPLEKQLICEMHQHIGKKRCNDDKNGWTLELDDYLQSKNVKTGQTWTCDKPDCALVAGSALLKAYELVGLDLTKIVKALNGFEYAVRYFIHYLLKNDIGTQSLEPRPGAIFFRDSYESGDHTGVVVCVDKENRKFWTIEGNVNQYVRYLEYSFDECATTLHSGVETSKNSGDFTTKMRFIYLTEQGGTYNEDCKCSEEPKPEEPYRSTTKLEEPKPDCLTQVDCIRLDKNRRYAIYTDDGWFVFTGESGFGSYGKNKWLKAKDLANCNFVEVKCEGKCGCEGGGCDCQTLQDKLEKLRTDLQTDTQTKYDSLIDKLKELCVDDDDDKTLLQKIIDLIIQVRSGVYVSLNDGDEIDNRTSEILLLLHELRGIVEEMKYCADADFTNEMELLIKDITTELHSRTSKPKYDKSVSVLQDDTNTKSGFTSSARDTLNQPIMADSAVVVQDWYDKTIDALLRAIDGARAALENCTCEDINTPSGTIVNNYYDNEKPTLPDGELDKLRKLIKETTKETITETPVICEGGNCETPDLDGKFDDLLKKLKDIIPDIIPKLPTGSATLPESELDKIKDIIIDIIPYIIPKIPTGSATLPESELDKIKDIIIDIIPDIIPKLPTGSATLPESELDKLRKLIKETTKETITETPVICEGGNCETPDLDGKFDDLLDKLKRITTRTIKENIREEFTTITKHWKEHFKEIVKETECKECDNSGVIRKIENLRKDFYNIVNKVKEGDNYDNDNLQIIINTIKNTLDNHEWKVDIFTKDKKDILLAIRKLKEEITNKLEHFSDNDTDIEGDNYNYDNDNDYDNSEQNYNKNDYKKWELELDKQIENRTFNRFRKQLNRPLKRGSGYGSGNTCNKCGMDTLYCKCPKVVEEKIDRRIVYDYAKGNERSPIHETFDYNNNFIPNDYYNNLRQIDRGEEWQK